MRNFFQLPRDGRVDFRMPVAVQVGPNGGIGIEKLAAFHVAQHRARAAGDDHRFAPEPVAHLRERMPDKLLIELSECVHEGFGKSPGAPASRGRVADPFKNCPVGRQCSNARHSVVTSSAEWAAVKVIRSRAVPRATVG